MYSRPDAVAAGHTVCDYLTHGTSMADTVNTLAADWSYTVPNMQTWANIAVAIYCPGEKSHA